MRIVGGVGMRSGRAVADRNRNVITNLNLIFLGPLLPGV